MAEINKNNLKNALLYIPLVVFLLYFIEDNKTEEFKKHAKYSLVLLGLYIIISIIFKLFWLGWLVPLLFVTYLIISGILGYKAYSGEKVEVEILDEIGDKVQEKIEGSNNKKEL